jgi:hypothetical protein
MLRIVVSAVPFLTVSFARALMAQSEASRFEVVAIKPVPQPTPETIRSGTAPIAFDIDGARVRISRYTPLALLTRLFESNRPRSVRQISLAASISKFRPPSLPERCPDRSPKCSRPC